MEFPEFYHQNIQNSNLKKGKHFEDRFASLCKEYFTQSPKYETSFEEVWLWKDFPYKETQRDLGIDLVAKVKDRDEFWAIQCKFHDKESVLQTSHLGTFFIESGRKFRYKNQFKTYKHRMVVSTTSKVSSNLNESLKGQDIKTTILTYGDLAKEKALDWSETRVKRIPIKRKLREYQTEAIQEVIQGFKDINRGKLIMACGTGKTFTSLRILEEMNAKRVLYVVPSLALLGQTMSAYNEDKKSKQRHLVVCSDRSIRVKNEDEEDYDDDTHDEIPATNEINVIQDFLSKSNNEFISIVFSTYQSLDKIQAYFKASKAKPFDLVLCDEAHRCSGIEEVGKKQVEKKLAFSSILDETKVKRKKTLFMTATPKIYQWKDGVSDTDKKKKIFLSMDDETLFGKEFYRYRFSDAINDGSLSDYRVLNLKIESGGFTQEGKETKDEPFLTRLEEIPVQKAFARCLQDYKITKSIAFNSTIKQSKALTPASKVDTKEKYPILRDAVDIRHVDGKVNSFRRKEQIDWLAEEEKDEPYKILSNARLLSEGVDVPAVNGVIFLSEKKSQLDIVQAVGRCLRKSAGKKMGYVVIPIFLPKKASKSKELNQKLLKTRMKTVYAVLMALRSHDDRLAEEIDKIRFGGRATDIILFVDGSKIRKGGGGGGGGGNEEQSEPSLFQENTKLYFEILQNVGDKDYFIHWAKDIDILGKKLIKNLEKELKNNPSFSEEFSRFHNTLKATVNKEIQKPSLVKMFVQHQLTEPVFNSLFDNKVFSQNVIYKDLEKVLSLYKDKDKEKAELERFYRQVQRRASNIPEYSDKQAFLNELYEEFFKEFSKEDTKDMGIVYTPQTVVRFMIRMVDDVLQAEFGCGLHEKGIDIIDPFTGTGNFIVNVLDYFQTNHVSKKEIVYKYEKELHANDINLLPYYIATINIEEKLNTILGKHKPYEKICLVDTFQTIEKGEQDLPKLYQKNALKIEEQKRLPLKVIIANPPYKKDTKGRYEKIDDLIESKYASGSLAKLNNSLYDHFYRAFVYANERIKDHGIACFVTNNQFIDKAVAAGFRESLLQDYSSVYHFDFKGNARHLGKEDIRRQGGNVFDIMTGVGVTLLVKNPKPKAKGLYLYRVEDYQKKEQKLETIESFQRVKDLPFQRIKPQNTKWINFTRPEFQAFIPLIATSHGELSFFHESSLGYTSNREEWLVDFSKDQLEKKAKLLTQAVKGGAKLVKNGKKVTDPKNMNLNNAEMSRLMNQGYTGSFSHDKIIDYFAKPFVKTRLYWERPFASRPGQFHRIFAKNTKNPMMSYVGRGAGDFSSLVVDTVFFLAYSNKTRGLAFYVYEKGEGLFPSRKRENLSDGILSFLQKTYGKKSISKWDIFYYVYSILNSTEYKETYKNNLFDSDPRVPILKSYQDFRLCAEIGEKLSKLHLGYEKAPPSTKPTIEYYNEKEKKRGDYYEIYKMKLSKDQPYSLVYNENITIQNIPKEIDDFKVNGSNLLQLLCQHYKVKKEEKSGFESNPNLYKGGKYIFNLVLSIIHVSLESSKLIKKIPRIESRYIS